MVKIKNFKKTLRIYEGFGCTQYNKKELKDDIIIAETDKQRVVLYSNGKLRLESK